MNHPEVGGIEKVVLFYIFHYIQREFNTKTFFSRENINTSQVHGFIFNTLYISILPIIYFNKCVCRNFYDTNFLDTFETIM